MEKKERNSSDTPLSHLLELSNRKSLHISGVLEVIAATDKMINLSTNAGPLMINGSDLKIKNLNNADKKIEINGEINELKYSDRKKKFLEKVFK